MTPRGWTTTVLGEIGEYLNGRGFKKSEWRESGRPIIRIQNLTGSGGAFNYYDGPADERYTARAGDILMSWAATLGVYVWRGPEAVVNQHIFKVESRIDADFHRYLLEAVLGDLRRQTHGSGMVHITRPRFMATEVPLPPLAEQRRIVAGIEEQFSRLDAASESLQTAKARLRHAREAVASGLLHRSWPTVSLGDLSAEMRYGTSVKCHPDAAGPPVLRIPNVKKGSLDLADLKRATVDGDSLGDCFVEAGDLLFVRTNGSRDLIGRLAVVGNDRGLAFASYLIRARPDVGKVDPRWILLTLSTPRARAEIERRAASTAGQYNLNLASLRSLTLPLPPLDEQRRIVAEVEQRLSVIDAMAAAIDSAQRRSAALRRSILERAFRGELVPQDPSDEPAAVLLERIRAEREAQPRPRRSRRAGSTRTS